MKTKTLILFTFILIVSPHMLKSQQFDAGFRAGVSASQISGDDLSGYNKPGFYAGIFTSLDITDRSRISLEMNYVEKGSRKLAKPDKGIYKSYKLMLNYVEIPITYQYFINPNFSLEIGPSFGLLLKREDNIENQNGTIPNTKPFDSYELAIHTTLNYWIDENWAAGIRQSESILPVKRYEETDSRNYNTSQSRHYGNHHLNVLRFVVTYKI